MKIKPQSTNQNFKGLYNNKFLLNGLEKISDHSASFCAGVSLVSSLILRPVAISLTPKAEKENKKILTAESVASAVSKFAIVEAIALPIESAIKKIDNNPSKFLNKKAFDTLETQGKKLIDSKNYKFITQIIKMGSNLVSAIPKSMVGVALIPIVNDLIFGKKDKNPKTDTLLNQKEIDKNENFKTFKRNLSFGNLPKAIGKIISNEDVQKFAIKHSKNDKNIARNTSIATDLLLTSVSSIGIAKSKKIENNKKKPLIFNKVFSTLISLIAGCSIDKFIQKGTKETIKKFSQINKNNPKLLKYLEGINIARPAIIFALIYYAIIPVISTFASDKISNQKV